MPDRKLDTQRRRRTISRRLREAKLLVNGAFDTITRSWRTSSLSGAAIFPVPTATVRRFLETRPAPHDSPPLKLLGDLRTGVITLSGGERCCIPISTKLIQGIRRQATLAGMITNGYLLTAGAWRRLTRPASTICRSASTT